MSNLRSPSVHRVMGDSIDVGFGYAPVDSLYCLLNHGGHRDGLGVRRDDVHHVLRALAVREEHLRRDLAINPLPPHVTRDADNGQPRHRIAKPKPFANGIGAGPIGPCHGLVDDGNRKSTGGPNRKTGVPFVMECPQSRRTSGNQILAGTGLLRRTPLDLNRVLRVGPQESRNGSCRAYARNGLGACDRFFEIGRLLIGRSSYMEIDARGQQMVRLKPSSTARRRRKLWTRRVADITRTSARANSPITRRSPVRRVDADVHCLLPTRVLPFQKRAMRSQ